jgi:hypothetical protein
MGRQPENWRGEIFKTVSVSHHLEYSKTKETPHQRQASNLSAQNLNALQNKNFKFKKCSLQVYSTNEQIFKY